MKVSRKQGFRIGFAVEPVYSWDDRIGRNVHLWFGPLVLTRYFGEAR